MRLNVKKIKAELDRLGWTRYRLSQEMRVKKQWVYRCLGNSHNMTFQTVERFAKALNLDPRDLIE